MTPGLCHSSYGKMKDEQSAFSSNEIMYTVYVDKSVVQLSLVKC